MNINDKIYGEEKITEEVLIDLINSKSVQRLKNISQLGLPDEYFYRKTFSRFEHSLGVLVLARRFNCDLKCQIASVLHDVSHTAFSHVVDWGFGDPSKADFQDNNHLSFIEKSEIPKILSKYKINYEDVSYPEFFPQLDSPIPDICFDRMDYALRENYLNKPSIKFVLGSLEIKNDKLIFNSIEAAFLFSKSFLVLQKEHWAGIESMTRYHLMGEILKRGVDLKIMQLEDLWLTDAEIISKLLDSHDRIIANWMEKLRNGLDISSEGSGKEFVLNTKFRYVDPIVLHENATERLTEISLDYKNLLEKCKEESHIGTKVVVK